MEKVSGEKGMADKDTQIKKCFLMFARICAVVQI